MPKNKQTLIEIRNLTKVYQTPAGEFTAVNSIDVDVQKGEFVAIIGKSGSGKSTFINMITGIDRPTSGEIHIDGEPVHSFNESQMAAWRGKNLGIVFQFFQLFPTLTLLENVILPMELNGLYSKRERHDRAMQLLETVEMAAQAHKLPSAISGGQQQRVAIARALANDPPLIIADEPTGNLDSKTAAKIFSLFEELVDAGKTILMVTHDSDLARRANRTILISDGEVVNEYLVRALAKLSQDQLVDVARRIKPRVIPAGANIIRQGEMGDKFYILIDGTADVFIGEASGREILVNQLQRGQYFGEMALLGNGVRTATVKSSLDKPATIVELDDQAFSKLVKSTPSLRDELTDLIDQRNLYNQMQSISSLGQSALRKILKDVKPVSYEPGYEIIKQGDVGETFYLLVEGSVDVFIKNDEGVEVHLTHLSRGSYFGEMALMGDKRRKATVRVGKNKPAQVVELTAVDFEQIAGASSEFESNVQSTMRARKKEIEAGRKRK